MYMLIEASFHFCFAFVNKKRDHIPTFFKFIAHIFELDPEINMLMLHLFGHLYN
jgi:hypothetical protein